MPPVTSGVLPPDFLGPSPVLGRGLLSRPELTQADITTVSEDSCPPGGAVSAFDEGEPSYGSEVLVRSLLGPSGKSKVFPPVVGLVPVLVVNGQKSWVLSSHEGPDESMKEVGGCLNTDAPTPPLVGKTRWFCFKSTRASTNLVCQDSGGVFVVEQFLRKGLRVQGFM